MNNTELRKSLDGSIDRTVDILLDILNEPSIKKMEHPMLRKIVIDNFLRRMVTVWIDNGDVFNIANRINDIINYTATDYMYQFKMIETINFIKQMRSTSSIQTEFFSKN